MFSTWNYRQALVLSCLVMTAIFTPTVVKAALPKPAQLELKIAQSQADSRANDEVAIKKAILLSEQNSDWRPQIGTITIADNYAIATVYDQVTGGESVLRKEKGIWKVIGGGGGAITRTEQLVNYFKVPPATARRLLKIRASQKPE